MRTANDPLLLGPDQGVALLSVENEMVIIPAKNLF